MNSVLHPVFESVIKRGKLIRYCESTRLMPLLIILVFTASKLYAIPVLRLQCNKGGFNDVAVIRWAFEEYLDAYCLFPDWFIKYCQMLVKDFAVSHKVEIIANRGHNSYIGRERGIRDGTD